MITADANPFLFGHAQAERLLMQDFTSGKLAHGWIISGPKGIGKATLAYRFARAVLAGQGDMEMAPDHPVFRRMIAGSHTDFLEIKQLYNEKKEEEAREITVEQARGIGQFMSLTPGESQWRVVIIDAADALNVNSANAILKILEEPPPQALLLLVSHNPGRLLPTIRSRCRMLKLSPLAQDDFTRVIRHVLPDIDPFALTMLAQLSDNAPGIAVELHALKAVDCYNQILNLLSTLPDIDHRALHLFAEQWSSGQAHTHWQLLTRLLLCVLERTAKMAAGVGMSAISSEETSILQRLGQLHPPHVWAAKWQQCIEQFSIVSRLHLDYKQVIITFFHSIASQEGFHIGNIAA